MRTQLSFLSQLNAYFSIEKFFSVAILTLMILVITSIVPNSFAVSLAGSALCALLWLRGGKRTLFDRVIGALLPSFYKIVVVWLGLVVAAACLHAWARFFSPGYDLYWFTQAIFLAKKTGLLQTTSERPYPTILVQHWEPILYTAIPLAVFIKNAIVPVLWQGLGFLGGAVGAYRASCFLFQHTRYYLAAAVALSYFVLGFVVINPLSFDAHPPVFGGLLCIPWIFYRLLQPKPGFVCFLWILLLAQCGEVFLPIATTYLACLAWGWLREKMCSPFVSAFLCVCVAASGYVLLSIYQRYLGPLWSGLPYNYADRYAKIGGDGFGIIQYSLTHPVQVFAQIGSVEKIKTLAKIFCYGSPLFLCGFISKPHRKLAFFIGCGTAPYFLQSMLTTYPLLYATNTHYIGALGSQWWALSVWGLHAFLTQPQFRVVKNFIFKRSIPALVVFFLFLNSSEWRKSPLHPFRQIFEFDAAPVGLRHQIADMNDEKGILFLEAEWLCPLAATKSRVICGDYRGYFLSFPVRAVVARPGAIRRFYDQLPQALKHSPNGQTLGALAQQENAAQDKWVVDKDVWKMNRFYQEPVGEVRLVTALGGE